MMNFRKKMKILKKCSEIDFDGICEQKIRIQSTNLLQLMCLMILFDKNMKNSKFYIMSKMMNF